MVETCVGVMATGLTVTIRYILFLAIFCAKSLLPGATFTVKKTTDSGVDTLRDAIDKANATPEADTIVFAVTTGGGGVKTMHPWLV